jgi:hypothetical protein
MRRALQRQWRRSLAGLALLLVLGQAPALAPTINVGGSCTLVRAIVAANNDTTASGNCTKGSGADRIVLPNRSTQTLTAVNNNPDYGPTGLPIIRSNITIVGNNSTIRRAGTAPRFRILAVARIGNLRLQQTTVSGGVASRGSGGGGGVLVIGGTLTLTNSTISGNDGGRYGGGVASFGYYLSGQGDFDNSFLSITNSTISGNRASADGGGVDNSAYSGATITNSTISGNIAGDGGGVYNDGVTTLTHSTLSGNTAGSRGGGLISLGGRKVSAFA